ncbi:MAG: flagellar hook assembly protein FlgD [Deltaproteobacteria bacterium]|nr:flagellar hook assembly protein FlgD [Deltaproteobacteria bacterium]
MSITGAGSTAASTLVQPKNAVGSKSLNQSDFMKLFITQMQYQDPLKPMDNYQMASQLAQFSNMQATTRMSENTKKLLDFQTSKNNLQLLGLLNNQVQINGSKMAVNDGKVTPTEFNLKDATNNVQVQVFNAAGSLVWQEDKGGLSAGAYQLDWGGKNLAGKAAPDGLYSYKVNAFDAAGQIVDVDYKTTGKVTGVNFAGGKAKITIDGHIEASPDEILTVQ